MATYLDQLAGDPERLRRALLQVTDDQRALVRRMEDIFEGYVAQLDQHVLRLLMLRRRYGPGHSDTQEEERRTEDASKPVTELRGVLERQRELLALYQGYVEEFERTGALQSLASISAEVPEPGSRSRH
ncbi:MAG: hypothetical protein HY690_16655 [Chloroflexi bacterium]|nr:hypothetical protein [Chloroflexota bacterium]